MLSQIELYNIEKISRIVMKIILATSNKGKVKEIQNTLSGFEIVPFEEILEPFEIIENGKSFKENAIIKAKAVFQAINDKNIVVLSDDSGISVPIMGNKPGIKSARYAGENATARDNLYRLIDEMKKRNIKKTSAFYTACIALATDKTIFTVHGWMYGKIIDEARGEKGFGYDPMFIPEGFDNTLGELDGSIKKELSHRSKALQRIKMLL